MDKLTMAHEYLRDIIKASGGNIDVVEMPEAAWGLADAMQAEADNRNKAEAEQKRKEVREILNDVNTFIEREGQHFDDVEEWQPDWSQAPEWAEWWAIDLDENQAHWYEVEPTIDAIAWIRGTRTCTQAPKFSYQGNWQNSLRKRPEPKCEVDWSQAPKDATHYVIFADGLAYWHKSEKLECFDIAPSFGIVGMFVMERPNGF